jgi:hypothetical protein
MAGSAVPSYMKEAAEGAQALGRKYRDRSPRMTRPGRPHPGDWADAPVAVASREVELV